MRVAGQDLMRRVLSGPREPEIHVSMSDGSALGDEVLRDLASAAYLLCKNGHPILFSTDNGCLVELRDGGRLILDRRYCGRLVIGRIETPSYREDLSFLVCSAFNIRDN